MKLSISNIAWTASDDGTVYEAMKANGFTGLEIAPTRVFPGSPYDRTDEAKEWSDSVKEKYGFCIPSMQSIWYGRQERLFGSAQERETLLEYTKKAIDFASAVGCSNLVFGCPKNRVITEADDERIAVEFFREIGNYAADRHTVIGMEANPTIYNTNYIIDTLSALELIQQVDSNGFRLNLDVGTMIYNEERASILKGREPLIHHVHISEPGLLPIEERKLHTELRDILSAANYNGYVSIEMGRAENLSVIDKSMEYVRSVFA